MYYQTRSVSGSPQKNMGLGTEIGDVNLPARTQAV